MKITSVSMNRPLNRAQGAIKKVSSVNQALTTATVDEVTTASQQDTHAEPVKNPSHKSKSNLDTLGSEVDVWA